MREAIYQKRIVRKLFDMFPGCEIFELDPRVYQGVPDLLILYMGHWAMLEVKTSASAPRRPNQDYHVNRFNGMSFASFIYPENEETVLRDLQSTFRPNRKTRVSQPEQLSLAELRRAEAGSKVLRRNGSSTRDRSTPSRARGNPAQRKAV